MRFYREIESHFLFLIYTFFILMRAFKQYINEWKYSSDKEVKERFKEFPKDRKDLLEIITKRLKENIEYPYLLDIDTSKITDMSHLFSGYLINHKNNDIDVSQIKHIDISTWNTQNVTSFEFMFGLCTNVKWIDISGFTYNSALELKYMFYECKNLETIVGIEKIKHNNVNTALMFNACDKLKSIPSWYSDETI